MPLVIVPPLAVNMLIYDLFPTRSLIRYFLDQGFEVYLIDWGVPTRNQAKYNFGTYVKVFMPEMLKQVRIYSGQQQLSLHGWSLGGALSLCYTALFKDKDIKNLMILASPIDTHKAGYMGKLYGSLTKPAQWVRKHTPFRIRQHVPSEVFHIHGWQNTLGFKLTDPIGNLKPIGNFLKIWITENLLSTTLPLVHLSTICWPIRVALCATLFYVSGLIMNSQQV